MEKLEDSFCSQAKTWLGDAGFSDVQLLHCEESDSSFGDAVAVISLGPVLVRFTRERGVTSIALAHKEMEGVWIDLIKLGVLLGWYSLGALIEYGSGPIDRVVSRGPFRRVPELLGKLKNDWERVVSMLEPQSLSDTSVKIREIGKEVARAWMPEILGTQDKNNEG